MFYSYFTHVIALERSDFITQHVPKLSQILWEHSRVIPHSCPDTKIDSSVHEMNNYRFLPEVYRGNEFDL